LSWTVIRRCLTSKREESDKWAMNYTCALCGKEFESAWSEEEALAEKERMWGEVSCEQCVILCDSCYQIVASSAKKVH
jgi:DNA-directed RNA polymerase subunit RPC12/RpoP